MFPGRPSDRPRRAPPARPKPRRNTPPSAARSTETAPQHPRPASLPSPAASALRSAPACNPVPLHASLRLRPPPDCNPVSLHASLRLRPPHRFPDGSPAIGPLSFSATPAPNLPKFPQHRPCLPPDSSTHESPRLPSDFPRRAAFRIRRCADRPATHPIRRRLGRYPSGIGPPPARPSRTNDPRSLRPPPRHSPHPTSAPRPAPAAPALRPDRPVRSSAHSRPRLQRPARNPAARRNPPHRTRLHQTAPRRLRHGIGSDRTHKAQPKTQAAPRKDSRPVNDKRTCPGRYGRGILIINMSALPGIPRNAGRTASDENSAAPRIGASPHGNTRPTLRIRGGTAAAPEADPPISNT